MVSVLKKYFYFHNVLISYLLHALSPHSEKRKIVNNLMVIMIMMMLV